ncbi:S8 family serine peptidase [Terrilactibacillus sp. BCM23-1]|uniref:S8 family serine peptidase n=1 Tax=Terrilactibacillus tamarindi TaxID=2599694 RepID=A0A6N8CUQ6_9BACI|nr:S8 family serine peptidase [Terrilactibacillus tamarindi]MTT31896.1 S8 family serine peptidase [Terrilactibacillus tamarindi]
MYTKEFKDKKVDVFAPGEDIISLYFKNKMTLDTGVSFATAYTSGYAALLIQENRLDHKCCNQKQIKHQIQENLQIKKKIKKSILKRYMMNRLFYLY